MDLVVIQLDIVVFIEGTWEWINYRVRQREREIEIEWYNYELRITMVAIHNCVPSKQRWLVAYSRMTAQVEWIERWDVCVWMCMTREPGWHNLTRVCPHVRIVIFVLVHSCNSRKLSRTSKLWFLYWTPSGHRGQYASSCTVLYLWKNIGFVKTSKWLQSILPTWFSGDCSGMAWPSARTSRLSSKCFYQIVCKMKIWSIILIKSRARTTGRRFFRPAAFGVNSVCVVHSHTHTQRIFLSHANSPFMLCVCVICVRCWHKQSVNYITKRGPANATIVPCTVCALCQSFALYAL